MDNLMGFILSPIGAIVVGFIFKLIMRKMTIKQSKTVGILADGIEELEEVLDFIQPKDQASFEKFIKRVKKRVDNKLVASGADKKLVDKVLKDKGILNKSGNAD